MSRSVLAVIGIVALIEAAIWSGILWRRAAPPAPLLPPVNVLLVTIDTLRADALGASGNPTASTPWMDRLAALGLRFDRAHAHNVVTLPSHANILSGRYPFVHGVRDNAGFRFPENVDTLATLLKGRGYRTGAFVSAFPLKARFGLARGFDEYDDRLSSAARPAFLEQERSGAETVAKARAWLGREPGAPTFCWVHLYEPHFPYTPPEPFASKFTDNLYAGEVAAADAALGTLVGPILDAGSSSRTVIVVTADHGEALGDHGEATHGIFAYEATLHVPLIVYAAGSVQPGVRSDLVRHVDIMPTVLALLHLPVPADLDGRNLLAQPAAADAGRSYFEAFSGALNRGWAPIRGALDDRLKYIELPIPELYDLNVDPGEATNLAASGTNANALKAFVEKVPRGPLQTGANQDAATLDRLRSLGYVSSGETIRQRYSEADDPKRRIEVDRDLQEIVGSALAGRPADALAQARALTEKQPRMALAWLYYAHLAREQGDLKPAIGALERAHSLNPGNSETATLLGGYLTQDGRPLEAIALLTPYAASATPDLEVLTTMALAKARTGASEDALALLTRARRDDPSNPMLLVNEGTIQLMAGHRDLARQAFEAALAQDPTVARAHSSLAAVAIDEGRTGEALPHWRAAVAADPSEFGSIFALGVAQARAGRIQEARACLGFFSDGAPPQRYGPQIAQARSWLAGHP